MSGEYDGIYGDLNYVEKDNTLNIVRRWRSEVFETKLLRRGWMPAHPTLFLKKSVYQKHGDFNLDYKIASDYDFILRIFKDDSLKFSYFSEVLTKMRMGGISNGSFKYILKKSKEDYIVLKKNKIGGIWVLIQKNLSKLSQFFSRK